MALVKGTIGLTIRERQPDPILSQYSQAKMNIWLEELPMANLGETSKRVYHRILKSNAVVMAPKARASTLGALESSIKHVCDSLKKHYLGQSVSLSVKQQKIADLCQALQLEVAIGYKTIVEDLLNDEQFSNKLLPSSIAQALYYFHAVQLKSYQLYLELNKGIWQEIHILYQLAEQNQFHQQQISINAGTYTPLSLYKKINLLATINPNQLRQADIEAIANNLGHLIKKCDFGSDPEADYDFVVNLNADTGPFHRALVKNEIKAHYRGINLSKIVEILQSELKGDKQSSKLGINDLTLRHLLRAWGTMATRAFLRTAGKDEIKISLGLSSCHYLINKEMFDDEEIEALKGKDLIDSLEGSLKDAIVLENDDNPMYSPRKTATSIWNNNKSGPAVKADNMWEAVYIKKSSSEEEKKKPTFYEAPASKQTSSKYNYQEATIINVSPGGYCLKLEGLLPKQTQTGEILGLLEINHDGEHIWNVGTIRWILHKETDYLQLGVQLIAPNAIPALGQLKSSHMDKKNYQRCLFLPELAGIGQPKTILTSTIPFSERSIMHVKNQDLDEEIRLTKLVSSGYSYKQFEYKRLSKNNNEQHSDDTDDSEFDSLWDQL